MSLYLKLHNRVKKSANVNWLTPSQQEELEQIRRKIKLTELINLYGKHGSGKTFLCWILSQLEPATYVSSPLASPVSLKNTVIIDNFNYFRKDDFRRVSAEYALKNVDRFVVVTVHPFLEEQCVRVKMPIPTLEDASKMIENLQRIAPLLTIEIPVEFHSMWQVFRNLEVNKSGD